MSPVSPLSASGGREVPEAQRLAGAARQLEAVFVEQLFKAMRATVPDDGAFTGGTGEELFTGLMDQRMSELVPSQWGSSIGDALLRQFHAAAPAPTPAEGLAPPVPSLPVP